MENFVYASPILPNKVWNAKELNAVDTFMQENLLVHSLLGDFQGRQAMK